MKKKNSHCDYIGMRDADLRSVFIERMGRKGLTLSRLFDEVACAPARRFYISEERAQRLLLEKRRTGRWPHGMIPLRRRMMNLIEERVNYLMALDPTLKLKDAVFDTVNSPAPSFFLTPLTIRTLFYRGLNAC